MKSNKGIGSALLGFMALTLAGCGHDHTVQDYNAQKENQAQAETQATVQGAFNGILYSKMSGKPMGTLSVTVSGDTTIPTATTDGTLQQASIAADIVVTTKTLSQEISVTGGTYNIYSHVYQIDFAVLNPVGTAIPFRLAGTLDPASKTMTGTIGAVNYTEYGGTYRISANAAIPSLDQTIAPTDRATAMLSQAYRAQQTIVGTPDQIDLAMSATIRSPEQQFLELFYPVRFTTVVAKLTPVGTEDSISFPFVNCEWDLNTKTLSGELSSDNGSKPYHFALQCTEAGTAKSPAWNCNWTGTDNFNFAAKAVAK